MFTGIVTDVGEVVAVEPRAEGLRRLKVACRYPADSIAIGASISHSGVCLTVVETGQRGNSTAVSGEAAAETRRRTTAARTASRHSRRFLTSAATLRRSRGNAAPNSSEPVYFFLSRRARKSG